MKQANQGICIRHSIRIRQGIHIRQGIRIRQKHIRIRILIHLPKMSNIRIRSPKKTWRLRPLASTQNPAPKILFSLKKKQI